MAVMEESQSQVNEVEEKIDARALLHERLDEWIDHVAKKYPTFQDVLSSIEFTSYTGEVQYDDDGTLWGTFSVVTKDSADGIEGRLEKRR